MKKLLSLLLALALVFTALPFVFASAEDETEGVFVVADGTTYKVSQGDILTYVYYLNIGEKAIGAEGELCIDTDGLEMVMPVDEDDEPDITAIFPIIGEMIVNDTDPSRIVYNFSNPGGKPFNKNTSVMIRAEFIVTAASGEFHIDNRLKKLQGSSDTLYIDNWQIVNAPIRMQGVLLGLTPYGAVEPDPTELPTEQPSDAPEPTTPTDPDATQPTDAPLSQEDVTLIADGVPYLVHQGDVIEYVYYLNLGEKLAAIEGDFYYSADGLSLIYPENEYGLQEQALFPKIILAVIVNQPQPGQIKYNYSKATGIKFATDTTALICTQFTVTAASGTVEITNCIHELAGVDDHYFIYHNEAVDQIPYAKSKLTGLHPIGYEPTEAPTDVTEAPDEPTADVTDAPTSAPDVTEEPTDDLPPSSGLFVVADGVTYKVRQGEIFEYAYYLNIGEGLSSLEGTFHYDADGLELIPPEPKIEEQEDYYTELIFPKIWGQVTLNDSKPGYLPYNFTEPYGTIKFNKDTSALIKTKFRVTASEGTYQILNHIFTLAGPNEHKFLYRDEVLEPVLKSEGGIPAKNPYDPDNPEPDPTEPPTDPPTEAPTDPPTEAPTDPPTEAPTDPPTEAPTDPPTEAPTDPPTEAPTDPPTEAPTDPPTEPPTEAPTDPPERALVDPATGVRVVTDLDAELVVTRIMPADFNYYLYNADKLALYEISLVKDGAPVIPDKDVKVKFPAATAQAVYRFDECVFTGVPANEDSSEEFLVVMPQTLGLFVTSSDLTPPKACLYGNVDGDRDITIVDSTFIQRHLADIDPFDADQEKIGDCDLDGAVTIMDTTYIQRFLASILFDNPLYIKRGYLPV